MKHLTPPGISVDITFRYEPDPLSGSFCHIGAGAHLHDSEFFAWWDEWGTEATEKGPPTHWLWTAKAGMQPRWE